MSLLSSDLRRAEPDRMVHRATAPSEIFALARTRYGTEPLQRALAHAGIPHRVLGSLGLHERAEVRDALAYLTLLENPKDAQALWQAVGAPRRGVGAATLTRLVAWARGRHGGELIAACANAEQLQGVRSVAARERLAAFGAGALGARSGTVARAHGDRRRDASRRVGAPLPAPTGPHPGSRAPA